MGDFKLVSIKLLTLIHTKRN